MILDKTHWLSSPKNCTAHARYHVIRDYEVKSNPAFCLFCAIQCAPLTELSITTRGISC